MISKDQQYWMHKAMEHAKLGHTPFGAVIVTEEQQSVEAYNTTKQDGPVAHAEINVIQQLKRLKYTYARTLTLYSTVEPCPMCMSAILWAGIGKVVYGASIADASAFGHQIHISCEEVAQKSWYSIALISGVEREKCLELFEY
ncbi:nucleoside deaminase [Psychroflexus sediminis]|uniref:tRNA(Arg) A34 adenosine deaminase TadA n=1 Tax=Psychroflexus sediminis TaxID=470826 RepID=A0A1G7VXL1_9FLAO|nr:nucleoside deaminase [Psychroflexus sediminis]SDG64502.1 tRNA(Arg) A34 adenosine deaminase TadA [Psychroflexus sediminis]